VPDHRNRERQKFCKRPECRKVSKAASQQKWLQKPENKDHFKGPVHTQRVQEWRKQHPGYWRREIALQDPLNPQHTEINKQNAHFIKPALQDLLMVQPTVLIGLISSLIGSALQDDIDWALLRMQQYGQDILYGQPKTEGENDDFKNPHFTRPGPQSSQKFQLDRPSTGQ